MPIMDSAEIFGQVFGYRNMKNAAILDLNAKKTKVLVTFSLILKEVFKKTFFYNGNYLTLESLKYRFKQRENESRENELSFAFLRIKKCPFLPKL